MFAQLGCAPIPHPSK